MSELVMDNSAVRQASPSQAVTVSVRIWFTVAALGHWIFLAYLLAVFFPPSPNTASVPCETPTSPPASSRATR